LDEERPEPEPEFLADLATPLWRIAVQLEKIVELLEKLVGDDEPEVRLGR
jgi:hypothetical protein